MQNMDTVYRQYSKMVYRYLFSLTRDADLADELTQETFYQAIKSIERFEGDCKLSTWLCSIAKKQLQNYYRKARSAPDSEQDNSFPNSLSAETETIQRLEAMELIRLLHEIPDPYREVLYLRLFGNLSFAEIGSIMGRTENWSRVTYYRGKERLRKEWEKNEN